MANDAPYQSQLPGGGNNVPDHYSRKIYNQYLKMVGKFPIGTEDQDQPEDTELKRFLDEL